MFKKDANYLIVKKFIIKFYEFSKSTKITRRRSTRRSGSMLSTQNTPNASEMDMRRNELMGSYRVRSRSSKKTIDASKVQHTTLGKKKKSRGKGKSKTKRKSTVI